MPLMDTLIGAPRYPTTNPPQPPGVNGLARHLCQVTGLNQNYTSKVGTPYHVQIEDRGPLMDAASEQWVRRVNVIVYANYGEPNARIVHGRDHDFEDLRSQEHNRLIERRIQELAQETREVIEEREERMVRRGKAVLREYHRTKGEAAKREFEDVNTNFPFVFSRAFFDLRQEKGRPALEKEPPPHPPEPDTVDVQTV